MDVIQPPAVPTTVLSHARDAARLAEIFHGYFPHLVSRQERDTIYFQSLVEDFAGELDVEEELKRYFAWTLDRPQAPETSPRSRFRDWLLRARMFRLKQPR